MGWNYRQAPVERMPQGAACGLDRALEGARINTEKGDKTIASKHDNMSIQITMY
jgi:hypothetical protein